MFARKERIFIKNLKEEQMDSTTEDYLASQGAPATPLPPLPSLSIVTGEKNERNTVVGHFNLITEQINYKPTMRH